jgi:hypothetical protein
MSTLKRRWDKFLEYSIALATVMVMVLAAVALLWTVGFAVVVSKILIFIDY